MAKRKAARASTRRAAGNRTAAGRGRGGASTKKAAPRQAGARKTAKPAAKSATKAGRTKSGATARKTATKRPQPSARKTASAKKTARSAPPSRARKPEVTARKSPSLNRARRVVTEDEDIVQATPPSSLDLDRSASAARTGRRSLRERYAEHTETSPALTGGDVDADWESAYSVGDEAPGGDNPTPDQDIVDDIGRAVGIEYQDNEELKGADKVEKRDRKRWELDPASSEDWEDR